MRLSLLLLALAALSACSAGTVTEPRGLVVDNPDPDDPRRPFFFDVGTLEHGTQVDLPIHLINTDPVPVTILQADPACLCTRAERIRLVDEDGRILREGDVERRGSMLRVPPGGRVQLLVGVNTRSVLPNKEKLAVMRVRTDSVNTPFLMFEIHLATEKPFTVTPPSIHIGAIPQGYGGAGQCEIMTGRKGGAERIVDVLETRGGIEAELGYVFVNEEHVWTLTATVPPLLPKGPVKALVVLRTEDGSGAEDTLEVDVWATVVDDVGFEPRNPHFGGYPRGESKTLLCGVVARVPGMRIRLQNVRLEGQAADHLTATFQPQPGAYVDDDGCCERWEVRLVADAALPPGTFEATLVANLDDDQYPEVRTVVRGLVR